MSFLKSYQIKNLFGTKIFQKIISIETENHYNFVEVKKW